jgi:hypothetical protein
LGKGLDIPEPFGSLKSGVLLQQQRLILQCVLSTQLKILATRKGYNPRRRYSQTRRSTVTEGFGSWFSGQHPHHAANQDVRAVEIVPACANITWHLNILNLAMALGWRCDATRKGYDDNTG